jgi:hypothetical protein
MRFAFKASDNVVSLMPIYMPSIHWCSMTGYILRIQHADERRKASILKEGVHGCLHADVTKANREKNLCSQQSLENVKIKVPHVAFSAHHGAVFASGSLSLLKAPLKFSVLSENGITLCDR